LLSLMKYGSSMKPKDFEKQPQERMTAEQIESQGGGGNPNLDPSGIGAEAAGMLGQLAGQAASGQGKVQQYYADEAQRRMEDAKKGGTSETAGDPQITGLMGDTPQTNPQGGKQQGQQMPPPGNTTAQTNPDIGQRMQFEQPVQHQTPQPDTQGQGQPKKLNPLEGSYRSKSAP